MRGRSLRAGTWLLTSVLLACAPAPSPTPSPSLTPPPVPAEFVPWPDIVWEIADLPPRPVAAAAERVVAVTATPAMFVAVGYREVNAVRNGMAWTSMDGETWEAVDGPVFAGIELVDVAPAPEGFVALGAEDRAVDGGGHPTAVAFASKDGASWRRLPPLPATGDTDPMSISGGSVGVIALADDIGGGSAVWLARDGEAFRRVALAGPSEGGLVDPHLVADGFVALGGASGPPSLLRSADALAWTATPIDSDSNATGFRLVPGRWGLVAVGMSSSDCDAACPVTFVAWWSGDGRTWGSLPGTDTPLVNGVSVIVPAGDHGVLAVDGADAWSSPDGWAWRSLPEPGDGSISIDDAVVRDDVIVAVGGEAADDGSSAGRILVAR